MADVIRTRDQFKLTFTLQNMEDAEDIVTRDLSFDVAIPIQDSTEQKTRFTAFRTTYMTSYANAEADKVPAGQETIPIGSLIQPSNFRDDVVTDDSDQSNLYKCTDITGAYITTVERYFDNNA